MRESRITRLDQLATLILLRMRSGRAFALAVLMSIAALLYCGQASASETLVPFLDNASADSALANNGDMIIVVMFEYEDCPWCKYILEHEIEPIVRSGAFKSTVLFRRAYISDDAEFTSFDGTRTSASRLARAHSVSISPTLVFLSGNGDVLAPPLVGVSSRDFYGFYLEKSIAKALARLGETS